MPERTWMDTLLPKLDEMRRALSGQTPQTVALLTGAAMDDDNTLRLPLWADEWLVSFPAVDISGADGRPCPPDRLVMLLYYLLHADGVGPAGRWIAFHDLPNGTFYNQAFQGYSGNKLAGYFVNNIEAFREAARSLGGSAQELGDTAYAFRPLPRVLLAAQYWQGDDEFAPRAYILFDASAGHYLPTDGLAILGSQLVGKLIKAQPGLRLVM